MCKPVTDPIQIETHEYNQFVHDYQPKCWGGPIYDFVSFYRVDKEEYLLIKETRSIENIEYYENAFYYKEAMEEFFQMKGI
jgi:hypothetical protein